MKQPGSLPGPDTLPGSGLRRAGVWMHGPQDAEPEEDVEAPGLAQAALGQGALLPGLSCRHSSDASPKCLS